MKPEQQVVSLDLARRLKELGVKQESVFWWQATFSHPMGYECADCSNFKRSDGNYDPHPCAYHVAFHEDGEGFDIAAFTVAELGSLLPDWTQSHRTPNEAARFVCTTIVSLGEGKTHAHFTEADTEADARGKMLVYLLENKLA